MELQEGETVFVAYGIEVRIVLEARVTYIGVHGTHFSFETLRRVGMLRLEDENLTWARPEHADLLRVTVALSA